jgi:transcriptional regulator with XRE-family HTH domain
MTHAPVVEMTDVDFRKAFGARVKEARKSRQLTQKELAHKLGVHFQLLNKYESGNVLPQPENIVLIADLLEVSLDYLLTGKTADNHDVIDNRLMDRVRALAHFPKEDQDAILRLIDAVSVRTSVQGSLEKIRPRNGTTG